MNNQQHDENDLFAHITDPRMLKIYMKIGNDDYEVYLEGKKSADISSDALAVLEAVNQSLENIIDDLDEHGEANESLYDDHDIEYFEEEKRKVEEKIQELRSSGKTSTIFAEYRRKYDAWIDQSATDFVDEMKAAEAVVHKIQMANNNPEAMREALNEWNDIVEVSQSDVSNINASVSNGILTALKDGKNSLAMDIVRAYVMANVRGRLHRGDVKNEEMLLVHMLAAPGFTGKHDDVRFVIESVLPMYSLVAYPRALFNAACLYALAGDKEKMIETIKKARAQAGKTKKEFMDDAAFKEYIADPEFLAAIG